MWQNILLTINGDLNFQAMIFDVSFPKNLFHKLIFGFSGFCSVFMFCLRSIFLNLEQDCQLNIKHFLICRITEQEFKPNLNAYENLLYMAAIKRSLAA